MSKCKYWPSNTSHSPVCRRAEEEVFLAFSGKVSPPTQQLWDSMKSLGGYATSQCKDMGVLIGQETRKNTF